MWDLDQMTIWKTHSTLLLWKNKVLDEVFIVPNRYYRLSLLYQNFLVYDVPYVLQLHSFWLLCTVIRCMLQIFFCIYQFPVWVINYRWTRFLILAKDPQNQKTFRSIRRWSIERKRKTHPAASCITYLYLYLFKYTDNITEVIVYLCSMTVSDDQITDFNPGRPVLLKSYSQMANIDYRI